MVSREWIRLSSKSALLVRARSREVVDGRTELEASLVLLASFMPIIKRILSLTLLNEKRDR